MNHNPATGERIERLEKGKSQNGEDSQLVDSLAMSTHISNPSKTKVYKKPAIRHAEKRRTSTCRFADRVAQLSVDHYKATIPIEQRPPQTCIATILAHYQHDDKDQEGKLWILSMGVGTKFLPELDLQEEVENESRDGYGSKVRDMHAEVLARRAFRRQLTLEIQEDLQEQQYVSSEMDITLPEEKKVNTVSVLVRCNDETDPVIRYRIRPGLTLHMYTSSAPCGNATLKKFCKMSKERFREDLGPDEWPQTAHEPPPGHSIKLGEFSLLVKKNNPGSNMAESNSNKAMVYVDKSSSSDTCKRKNKDEATNEASMYEVDHGTKRTRKQDEFFSNENKLRSSQSRKRRGKPWPATLSDDWVPPGTTIVGYHHKGSIHTCSDKICRWNYLGLQGSLLAGVLEEPLYLSTLTVGRKLSGAVCRRAICCRLDTRCKQPKFSGDHSSEGNSIEIKYRVNHPAVLGTAVYMDDGVVDTSNIEERGQDVRFHSSVVWTWWLGKGKSDKGILECIESASGLLPKLPKEDEDKSQIRSDAPMVSTKELISLFLQVYHRLIATRNSSIACENNSDHEMGVDQFGTILSFNNTLSGIREIKKTCSPMHETFKDLLLTEHKVLSQWRRREDRNKCTYCVDNLKP